MNGHADAVDIVVVDGPKVGVQSTKFLREPTVNVDQAGLCRAEHVRPDLAAPEDEPDVGAAGRDAVGHARRVDGVHVVLEDAVGHGREVPRFELRLLVFKHRSDRELRTEVSCLVEHPRDLELLGDAGDEVGVVRRARSKDNDFHMN